MPIGTCSIADGSSGLELPHGQSPPDQALALSVPKIGKEFDMDGLWVKKNMRNMKDLIILIIKNNYENNNNNTWQTLHLGANFLWKSSIQ